MTTIRISRQIHASKARVFSVVADIRNFSMALPHIERYEFLTEQQSGVGTRFRETRLMGKREMATELKVTEYDPDNRVRMVAENHGTVWDTIFTTDEQNGTTELTMIMDAKARRLLPRMMNRLIRGMITKAVARDMDLVKEYCESRP